MSHDMSLEVKICEILNMHLFSDHVSLKLEVDIEHAAILPREHCVRLAWDKAGQSGIYRYNSDLE